MSWAGPLAAALLWACAEGALLVALVALLLRALPKLPATVRCTLWWAACLKLVLALAWPAPIELAWLPASAPHAPSQASRETASSPVAAPPAAVRDATATASPDPRPRLTATAAPLLGPAAAETAATLLVALWMGVLAVLAVRGARQLAAVQRTLREAHPVRSPAVLSRLATLARRARVAPPRLLVSPQTTSPQVTGLARPAVLLPAAVLDAGGSDLDMILAHELAHLRRRDLLFGWVPALAARLFFFHPLAALAAREYALAREAACDAEALRLVGAAPRDYGRMLLTWGVAREAGPLAALSLGDTQNLKRRLLMLERNTTFRGRRPLLAFAAVLPVLLLLLPLRLTPAQAAPGPQDAQHHWNWNSGAGQPLVLLKGDDTVSFNTSMDDTQRAKAARRGSEDLLWFEQGGTAYVIRDRTTLKRVRQALEPALDLAKQQGELGGKQGELGGEQGKLGGEQGELGAEMGRLGAEMGALGGELAAVVSQQVALEMGDGDEAALAELEAREEEVEAKMDALEAEMEALGEQMEALGEQQEALGERQAEMGERQAELGRKQAAATEKAMAEVGRILDDAVRSGKAERVG